MENRYVFHSTLSFIGFHNPTQAGRIMAACSEMESTFSVGRLFEPNFLITALIRQAKDLPFLELFLLGTLLQNFR
jgi:hypothetical protein